LAVNIAIGINVVTQKTRKCDKQLNNFVVETNWGTKTKEWKVMPDRKTFTDVAKDCMKGKGY
jgi:hypothetical protein